MTETTNIKSEDLEKIIAECPYEMLFNKVIVSLNKEETIGLNFSEVGLSSEQYVISGSFKFNDVIITPGDKVLLDLDSLKRPSRVESTNAYETEYKIEINPVFFGERMYAIINDRNILAKIK